MRQTKLCKKCFKQLKNQKKVAIIKSILNNSEDKCNNWNKCFHTSEIELQYEILGSNPIHPCLECIHKNEDFSNSKNCIKCIIRIPLYDKQK